MASEDLLVIYDLKIRIQKHTRVNFYIAFFKHVVYIIWVNDTEIKIHTKRGKIMKSINLILKEIVKDDNYNQESLAKELGISPSTVSRWLKGESKPRPLVEGQLREIYQKLQHSPQYVKEPVLEWLAIPDESGIREAIDATLRELREILHRRGRLSSRNEALDELSKLLFAHVMSIVNDKEGICKKIIYGNKEVATCLKAFVDDVFKKYLPTSLSHEIEPSDFVLKIKSSEDVLATEIVECFEKLAAKNKIKSNSGTTGIDILNDVFGKFLANSFVDEKQLGQYLTPTEVVRFMVRLAIQDLSELELEKLCNPYECHKFGLILDPSCGVASFLTETLRTLQDEVVKRHEENETKRWIESMVKDVFIGIDKSERMIRFALTNMAMFGFPAAKLHLANSLARFGPDSDLTESFEGKVTLILTNPPFGAEFEGNDLSKFKIATNWPRQLPGKVDSELLFIERYLDWLAPNGQLLAIVPDSILTNKGIYEDLRKNIADRIEIRSIISLPTVTFGAAGTSTKTSILHIRKRQSEKSKKTVTFFAICHNIGYEVTTRETHRKKITNGEGDLPKILQEYLVSNANLSYGRRITNVEKSRRWDANYHASLPSDIELRLNNPSSSDIFVSDVAELSRDSTDPRRWGNGTFQYIEIADVDSQSCMVQTKTVRCSEAPSRARKLVHAGDILFSTVRPERRTVGIVREDQEGSVCTTGFAVLRPKGIDSLALAYLLKTDFVTAQVLRNNIGIAYPAIDEACLPDIILPIRRQDLASLKKSAEAILDLEKKTQAMRENFSSEVMKAISDWTEQNPTPDPKLHQSSQTKSHRRSRREDFDVHGQGTLKLWEDHKV